MAVYPFGKAPTTRTRSRWGSCTGGEHHVVGDADLFNDQVAKIGKNSHRLGSRNGFMGDFVLFFSIPHLSSSSLRENQTGCVSFFCKERRWVGLTPTRGVTT